MFFLKLLWNYRTLKNSFKGIESAIMSEPIESGEMAVLVHSISNILKCGIIKIPHNKYQVGLSVDRVLGHMQYSLNDSKGTKIVGVPILGVKP